MWQSEKYVMDASYGASERLLKQLLGRILPPPTVASLLNSLRQSNELVIDFSQTELLPSDDIDIGDEARIEISALGDDTEPEYIVDIINQCVWWVQ